MLATLVPDIVTQLPTPLVIRALRRAYETICGKPASDQTIAVLWAQCALETGRWKFCHCHNWGNVKASPTYAGYYTQFRCNEVLKDPDGVRRTHWFDPPHPQTNFRAYLEAETGAVEHLRFLREHYATAWHAAELGAPLSFVEALAARGYFTADPAPYSRSVASMFREALANMASYEDGTEAPPVLDDAAQHLAALEAVAWREDRTLHYLATLAAANYDPVGFAAANQREWDQEP